MLKHDGGDHKLTNRAPLSCLFGVIPVSLLTLTASFLAGLSLVDNTSATAYTLTVSITDNISVDILPTTNGTFATSDTSANNISVTTNNGTGYTLGIKAKTENSNALINTVDNTKTIPSISSSTFPSGVSASNYADNTYALANNLNNTYAYKPSKLNSANNSNYLALPTSASTTTILDRTTVSNPSTANNYNIAIGTRIDKTQASGSYANTFVISVVVNPAVYSITYNANGGSDTVTNMPTNVSNQETYNTSVDISSTVPVRNGYNFKGWCTTQTADEGTCSGTTYNPDGGGASLAWTLDQTAAANNLTLYAMWMPPSNLYNAVASAWANEGSRVITNDTDTNTGIQADITTSNSGVFKYDPSTFGVSSDASNDYDIYFYRGILDTTTGSYGSDGDNLAHPNTVILDTNSNGKDTTDTCWRIVRTTGSGGVKMIYQGKWTGSTCANSGSNARVTNFAFNDISYSRQQIVRIGYTYNSSFATTAVQSDTIANIFGNNSNPSRNDSRSDIKEYIEDTWYANNMTSYTSMLEPSAGYCNDRTMNTTQSWTTPLAESSVITTTYAGSSIQDYYFGAYPRNNNPAQPPSLTCAKYSNVDRSIVDLYRYVANSTGVSNELKYPAALLTADEASFAGSGMNIGNHGSSYHTNSFLSCGSYFWLLSPRDRSTDGAIYGFLLTGTGSVSDYTVYTPYGVRPAISLNPGTTATSGTGTATDPWIVTP